MNQMEMLPMKEILSCIAVAGLLAVSSSSVLAAGGGASRVTPAYAAANPGSTLKPVQGLSGAPAYAPGQQMNAYGPGSGHGASVYAPGFLKNSTPQ
jgi:hypothetical protein